jgi:hypothetical protein
VTANRQRALVFAVIVAGCVAVAAIAVGGAVKDTHKATSAGHKASAVAGPRLKTMLAGDRGVLFFRSLDRGHPNTYGNLGFASLDDPNGARTVSGLRCDRISFTAGRGLCIVAAGGIGTVTKVTEFDDSLRTLHTFKAAGLPSRTRVSPDAKWAGITTFVGGHSYGTPGKFSTATEIVDLATGRQLPNLEQWKVVKDGKPFHHVDFNFWGLTFSRDDDTFYATLATGNVTYLVRGSIRARTMTTIHQNVECPSLSPDETRIAYKKKVGGPPAVWHFYVLDLKTGKETALAESRTIDDQIAWLDDRHVLYDVDETTWTANADGTGTPHEYLTGGTSPQVARPSATPKA